MKSKFSRIGLPLTLLIIGLLLLAYSVIEQKGEIHWIVFIPVFSSTSIFAFIGTILIIVGIFLFFWGWIRDVARPAESGETGTQDAGSSQPTSARTPGAPRTDKRFGGIVLIGPIPVIFGSDPKMAIILIGLAIVLIIVTVLLLTFYLGSL
jgi:uncharacterized protein (TIGR00304 family)